MLSRSCTCPRIHSMCSLDRDVFVLGPGIFDMLDSKVRHTFGIPCALPVGRSIVVVSASLAR